MRSEPLELLQASTLCPSIIAEYGDCNGRTLTYDPNVSADPKDDSSPEEDTDDDVSYHESPEIAVRKVGFQSRVSSEFHICRKTFGGFLKAW